MKTRGLLIGAAIACVLITCATTAWYAQHTNRTANDGPHRSEPPSTRASANAPRVSAPFPAKIDATFNTVFKRTHYAFHRDGDAFVGGDASYVAAVTGSLVQLSPEVIDRNGKTVKRGHPVAIHTARAGRTSAHAIAAEFQPTFDGGLTANRGDGVTEQLRNTAEGLEQEWRVAALPEGTEPFEIHIAVSGMTHVATTEKGLHFRDSDSELGVVYGNATVIDADGHRTGLVASLEGAEIVFHVPESVLETSTYPIVIDPTVGAEFAVDTPVYAPAADLQTTPAVGHSGIHGWDYLVVWADRRRSLGPNYPLDIYAAHVDSAGNLLDAVGFLITANSEGGLAGNHNQPSVVYSVAQSGYIIVYSYDNCGGSQCLEYVGLPGYQGRTPNAAVPLPVTCNVTCTNSSLAINTYSDGERLGVTYADQSSVSFYAFTISAALGLTQWGVAQYHFPASGITGTVPRIAGSNPTVGLASNWLVVFQDGNQNILGSMFNENGTPITVGLNGVIYQASGNNGYSDPDIAYVGSTGKWLLVATYNIGGLVNNYDIEALEISTAGVIGAVLSGGVANGSHQQQNASIAGYGSNGTQAFVTWEDSTANGQPSNLVGIRLVDNPLALQGSYVNITTGATAGGTPRVHSDDFSLFFVVWSDNRGGVGYNDIYGARVDYSGNLLSPTNFLISQSANAEISPAVGYCNSHYLVAWADDRNGYPNLDIYGTLLDSAGNIVVQDIAISTATGKQDLPEIACNGTDFYVVWADDRNTSRDIYGTGVNSTTGALLNGTGVLISNSTGTDDHPNLAYGSGNYKVVWDRDGVITYATVSGTAGTVITAAAQLDPSGCSYPDIASDGTNFWIVFQRVASTQTDIYGTSLTAGSVHGAPVALDTNTANQRYPRISWDGGMYTVVYEDDRNLASFGTDIYGRRFQASGTLGPFIVVAHSTANEYGPRIVLRGKLNQEVLYWTDPSGTTFDFSVYGQLIANGVVSGAAYLVSGQSGIREMSPALACSALTSCLVGYRWFNASDTTTDADRIKARLVSY